MSQIGTFSIPEEPNCPVHEGSGNHEARVKRAADDPTERVPTLGIKPVPELIEALLGEEEGGPVIEVGIELVDHALVPQNAEEARDEGQNVHQAQDRHPYQHLLLLRLQLEGLEGGLQSQGGRGRRQIHCRRTFRLFRHHLI